MKGYKENVQLSKKTLERIGEGDFNTHDVDRVFPQGALFVLIDLVLSRYDRGDIHFALGEADFQIAQYCNQNECAGVLTTDSDFFILNVPRVILVDKLKEGIIYCTVYCRDQVLPCLSNLDPEKLPYLAALVGCDYLSKYQLSDRLKEIGGVISISKEEYLNKTKYRRWITGMISYLLAKESVGDIIADLTNNNEWELLSSTVNRFTTPDPMQDPDLLLLIPERLLEKKILQNIILRNSIMDFARMDDDDIYENLKPLLELLCNLVRIKMNTYDLPDITSVYVQKNEEISISTITINQGGTTYDISDAYQYLIAAIYPHDSIFLRDMSPDDPWTFMTLILVYLQEKLDVEPLHIKALISMKIALQKGQKRRGTNILPEDMVAQEKFQSCIFWFQHLAFVLEIEFMESGIEFLYDGSLFSYAVQQER